MPPLRVSRHCPPRSSGRIPSGLVPLRVPRLHGSSLGAQIKSQGAQIKSHSFLSQPFIVSLPFIPCVPAPHCFSTSQQNWQTP